MGLRRDTVRHDPFEPIPGGLRWVIAIVALGFLLSCHLRWIDEPFDSSLAGVTSGEYYGIAARAFDTHGLWAMKLQPAFIYQEGTTETVYPYHNHPPGPHAVVAPAYRMLGRDERALRLPILALMALSVVGLFLVVRRAAGSGAAAAAAGLFCGLPLVIQYGNMVDAPMFSLAFLMPCVGAWLAWRARPGAGRYALYFAVGLLAGLADWFGYFVVIAAWIDLLLFGPRPARPWREAFLAGLPFGVALLAYFAWLAWATGGVAEAIETFRTLLQVPVTFHASANATYGDNVAYEYLDRMRSWFERAVTLPMVAAAGFGLLVALLRWILNRATRLDRLGLMLLVTGALPSVAFRDRAAVHEFWILVLAPALAVLAASGIGLLARVLGAGDRLRTPVAWVALTGALVLAGSAAYDGLALHDEYRTDEYRRRGENMNRVFRPDDVVLMPGVVGSVRFYCRATVIPNIHTKEGFEETMRRLAPGRAQIGRLFIAIPTVKIEEFLRSWDPETMSFADIPIIQPSEIEFGRGTKLSISELDIERAFAFRAPR